ncbi:MAG: undecaprenyl-diphosphate phosphatase [Phycisphaerae bacterium]
MDALGYGDALLLGLVQGLTEFLPVSSSGHLALTQTWLGLESGSDTLLLFDVVAHFGTVLAIMVVLGRSGMVFLRRLWAERAAAWRGHRHACHVMVLCLAATVPTAAIGLGFKDKLESAYDDPGIIGLCLLLTGSLLALMAVVPRPRRGWKQFGVWRAALIGVAQGLAILPGISRSGATICAALGLGLRRRWAAEFSFLIAMPAICGAVALKIKDTLDLPAAALADTPWGPILAGSVVSFATGVVALRLLLAAVRSANLHFFAIYCWLLGALVLWRLS